MGRNQVLRIGGVISGVVLLAFGIGVIVLALVARHTVTTELERQQIVGTPDMTPSAIKGEADKAGLENVDLPTCAVAGDAIDNGSRARCFAEYMNVHTLVATGGYVYSQMGRYAAKPDAAASDIEAGGGTNNPGAAAIDPKTQRPVPNAARELWVTETALATALNVSYMASQLALFSVVVGVALLLTGIGFTVLAFGALPRRAGEREVTPAPVAAS